MDKESENDHCSSVHYPSMGLLLWTGWSVSFRDYLWPKWSASTFFTAWSAVPAVRITVWSIKAKNSDSVCLLLPGKHIKSLLEIGRSPASLHFSAKWMLCTEHLNRVSWKLQTPLRIWLRTHGMVQIEHEVHHTLFQNCCKCKPQRSIMTFCNSAFISWYFPPMMTAV